MEYYGSLDVSAYSQMAYLQHHGILGQKYGVRNGPPYPLGSGAHSSSETSAAKKAGISVGGSSGLYSVSGKKTKPSLVDVIKKSSANKKAEQEKKRQAEEEATKKRRSDTLKRLRAEGKGFDGDDDEKFLDDTAKRYARQDRIENIDKMISTMDSLGYSEREKDQELRKRYNDDEMDDYYGFKDKEAEKSQKTDKPSAQNAQRQETPKYDPRTQAKNDAIASAVASNIDKYIADMSTQELKDAVERVNKRNEIKKNIPKKQDALDKFESATNTAKRVTNAAANGLNAYNTAASISNAVLKTNLPTFEYNNSNTKDDKDSGNNNKQNKQKTKDAAKNTINKAFKDAGLDQMLNEEAFEKAINDAADAWVNDDNNKKKKK